MKLPDSTREMEVLDEKIPLTPKIPKDRPTFDRVAILPPFKKQEIRNTSLAAEDTSLEDMKTGEKYCLRQLF